MRLLQVSLRSLLLYAIAMVLISIPVSMLSIRAILNKEVDESIFRQSEQFLRHIKSFEYLDDLETDLQVLDKLSTNIHIRPFTGQSIENNYRTISLYDSIEKKNKPYRQLSSMVEVKGKTYLLTIQMSLVDNNDLVRAIGSVQIALSILLTAGLLLLNRSLSKRLWKPFYRMLDQLKAYELDKTGRVPIEKSEIIEFNDLNKTISYLTERNQAIFRQQKEFIENASHELQTPIAVFQTKLDELMQSSNLSEEDAETIMVLESSARRMARLNRNLLLLSKIDNEQFKELEEVQLVSMIHNQLLSVEPMAKLEGIKFVTALEPLSLNANKTLIEILLTNLLHNAIRYSPKGESIVIKIHGHSLSITNMGAPLKMDFWTLTDRFKKDSSHPNSTGLGLAIVKKICDSYAYKLGYSYNMSAHTFSVTF